jgi:Flp pilus assembly pilin Flp
MPSLTDLFDRAAVALAVRRLRSERGQTTAEYALVLLGAASVALVLVGWAAKSGKLADLFDAVVDGVIDKL